MIIELLTALGFSEKEITVYLCVLKQGRITPANVARLTKINRSSVYFLAGELIRRGVIAEDASGSITYLLARPPEELVIFVEQQERELHTQKEKIKQLLPELQSLTQNSRYIAPRVTFVTEEQLSEHLYKRTPTWNESALKTGGAWWGFQDPSLLVNYPEYITWFWKQPSAQAILVKLFTNQAPAEQALSKQELERRSVKLWPSSTFTGSQWIAGDYIINIITSQHPHYLVEIRDAIMANNLRELFKGMWQAAPKLP